MLRTVALSLVVALGACTTTSTTTTLAPSPGTTAPSTTTTEPELCPDVFCLVYTVSEGWFWSDGVAVTVDDFVHTLELLTGPDGLDSGNPGYDLITDHEVIGERTLLVSMSEVFAPWRTLFEVVYPAHAETDPILPGPTSGPFLLGSWVDDGDLILARNPRYTGPGSPGDLQELRFVVADGVREVVSGLLSGDYQVINPAPQDWMLEDLEASSDVVHDLTPGAYWEHITFNHDDGLLTQSFVREAIAAALDREGILDATVRKLDPGAGALGNTMWMIGSMNHQDNFDHRHDPDRAVSILTDNGCERGGDGVFVCAGSRVSFVWATTVGDSFRSEQLTRAAEMLATAGIEVSVWTLAPSVLFSTPIFFGNASVWQMMSFAWKAGADPFLAETLYTCAGDGPHGMGLLNAARYCSEEVEDLVLSARGILDPAERARVLNQADRMFLDDVAMIPLYQRPSLLAWADELVGPEANPWWGDLWNVGAWTGMSEVAVAIERMPASLTAMLADDTTQMIVRVLYLGAFRVTPEMEYVPVLVDSVEVIVRSTR